MPLHHNNDIGKTNGPDNSMGRAAALALPKYQNESKSWWGGAARRPNWYGFTASKNFTGAALILRFIPCEFHFSQKIISVKLSPWVYSVLAI
jgi:hypothetical protein